jgi:hypothetical protein
MALDRRRKKAHSSQDAVGSGTPARLVVKRVRLRAQRRLRYGRSARLQAAYPDLAVSRMAAKDEAAHALIRPRGVVTPPQFSFVAYASEDQNARVIRTKYNLKY